MGVWLKNGMHYRRLNSNSGVPHRDSHGMRCEVDGQADADAAATIREL